MSFFLDLLDFFLFVKYQMQSLDAFNFVLFLITFDAWMFFILVP